MNSVVQCMYAVEPLRSSLISFTPTTTDPTSKLVRAAGTLVKVRPQQYMCHGADAAVADGSFHCEGRDPDAGPPPMH